MNTTLLEAAPLNIVVDDVRAYILNKYLLDSYKAGLSIHNNRSKWLHNSVEDFNLWISNTFKNHRVIADSSWHTTVLYKDALIAINISSNMASADIFGSLEEINEILNIFKSSHYREAGSTIEWVYDKDGNMVNIPLMKRDIIKSAYPWCEGGVDNYLDRFMASDASVLILYGPPGTGKTSFIRYMIARLGADASVAYDEKLMSSDSLFARWLESNSIFMCLEDSDAFLSARSDGNLMMHKFLNVSEGLVTVKGKKMIFSTNLPKVTDIDEALTRPGRCFDVAHFRELTSDEAKEVVKEIESDKVIEDGKKYSLASIFTNDKNKTSSKKGRFGFV